MAQRDLSEQLEDAEAVGEAAADRWERSLWADQALLDGGVAARSRQDGGVQVVPALVLFLHRFEHVEQHRLDDEAIVVIPMEISAVAVDAVALVPVHVVLEGGFHGLDEPGLADGAEGGLDHGGEE